MSKIYFLTTLVFLLCVSLISQAQKKQTRELSPFHGIRVATNIDVFLEEGSTEQVVIETDKLEWDWIITEVEDGILKVSIDRDKPWQNLKHNTNIYLTYKTMNYVKTTSSGDIVCKSPLHSEDIFVGTSSSGDVLVKNIKAKEVEAATSSSGDIKIESIEASECSVKTSSSGDVYVETIVAEKELDLATSSSGDLKIKNLKTNELSVSLSSSGDIWINSGVASESEFRASSSGDLYAAKLMCGEASAKVSSSGNLNIGTPTYLDASISSSGDIIYQGDPKINVIKDSSSGDVRRGK